MWPVCTQYNSCHESRLSDWDLSPVWYFKPKMDSQTSKEYSKDSRLWFRTQIHTTAVQCWLTACLDSWVHLTIRIWELFCKQESNQNHRIMTYFTIWNKPKRSLEPLGESRQNAVWNMEQGAMPGLKQLVIDIWNQFLDSNPRLQTGFLAWDWSILTGINVWIQNLDFGFQAWNCIQRTLL